MNRANLRGQRFGKLIALAPIASDLRGKSRWECRCDCGNGAEARTEDLQSGKVSSCGCLSVTRATYGVVTHACHATAAVRHRPPEGERSMMTAAEIHAECARLNRELMERMAAS